MSPRPLDRRIRRTRRLLRDACIALILEKGYAAVTVEQIAERADVGRTTFYMHYRDKADLFVRSIGNLSEEIYEQIAPLVFTEGGAIDETPILMIFRHAEANADLYRVILSGSGDGRGLRQLHRDLTLYVSRVLAAETIQRNLAPAVPIELIAHHAVGALLSLVAWWIEQPSTETGRPYTAEEMTNLFRQLTNLGRLQVMGLPHPD